MARHPVPLLLLALAGAAAGQEAEPPAKPLPLILPPVMDAPRVEACEIRLSWKDGAQAEAVDPVEIQEYVVYRRVGEGAWKRMEVTKSRRFVDGTAPPGETCAYRVTALGMAGKPERRRVESEPSGGVEAKVVEKMAIVFVGNTPWAAVVEVRKFLEGKWWRLRYTLQPRGADKDATGEIGKAETEMVDESSGNRLKLDLRTGYVLTKIEKARYRFTRIPASGPPVESSRDRFRMTCEDESGKELQLWMVDEVEGD